MITAWVRDWRAQASAAALALAPLARQMPAGIDVEQALDRVEQYADTLLADAGLTDGPDADGAEPVVRRRTRMRRQRRHPSATSAGTTAATAPLVTPDSYDYVGIVMARSAEGDAVAEILGRREDIEVIEQPAFWDIRTKVRLAIPYAEVSDQLGYEIDAYSIQHEMSTHYGRMVASDDALMLFSDPAEAMQYLMS